jgi:hypothetical protein
LPVVENGTCPLFLANSSGKGTFCCGAPYNDTSAACAFPNYGLRSYVFQPFTIPQSFVVIDRTNATLWYGNTTLVESTSFASENNGSTTITATASASKLTAISVGIAVPLGVLFLAATAAALVFFGQDRKLRKQLQGERSLHQQDMRRPPSYDLERPGYGTSGHGRTPSELPGSGAATQIDGTALNELPAADQPERGNGMRSPLDGR